MSRGGRPNRRKKGERRGGRHECGVCGVKEKGGENWIECDWCEKWMHQGCGGVSTSLFDVLASFDESVSGELHWYCRACYGEVKGMVAELKGGRKRQDVMESEPGGLRLVGEGDGKAEEMDEGKKSREEGGGEGRERDVDEIERAVGKMWKMLNTMQARQGAMEVEMNAVKIEILEERTRGRSVGELARVTEERVDRIEREFGEYGGRRDKMEDSLKYITELEDDMRQVFGDYGGRLDVIESSLKGLVGVEKDVREEMGRSNEGEVLLSVVKGDQGEQGGEDACVGGRGVLFEGHGGVVSGGDRDMQVRLSEEAERQSRRLNLVFMGIEEGSAEEDKRTVQGLVGVLLEGEQVEMWVGERVGRKGVKARPIRVVVKEAEQRRRILARARELRTMKGKEGIYIAPDRTRKQQEEDRVLRDKVKAFRNGGKVGVKISKGEVVRGEGVNREVLFRLDS